MQKIGKKLVINDYTEDSLKIVITPKHLEKEELKQAKSVTDITNFVAEEYKYFVLRHPRLLA
jgi:hypothetical protein